MEQTQTTIVTRIQELEDYLGCSQSRFAERCGLSKSNLSKMMNGILPISQKTIQRISDTFNVSYRWLKDGVGEMYEQPTGGNKIEGVSELIDDARAKTIMQQLGGHHNSQTAETAKADRQAEIDLLKKMVEDKDKEIEFLRQMLAKKE